MPTQTSRLLPLLKAPIAKIPRSPVLTQSLLFLDTLLAITRIPAVQTQSSRLLPLLVALTAKNTFTMHTHIKQLLNDNLLTLTLPRSIFRASYKLPCFDYELLKIAQTQLLLVAFLIPP